MPRCSFCHKSKDDVAILVASATDDPRAYICGECVEVCHSALNKPQTEPK
jgi:ATP-dependent Clp protease ATP-binding subunit ClpX